MMRAAKRAACALNAVMAVALALALAMALALCVPGTAFAEDEVAENNRVNPQQLPDSSFIYDTLISDLEKADSYMDGQTAQITGEAVGDRIRAELDRDHSWITVQAIDGSYAEISVYMSDTQAGLIDTFGMYGQSGTILQVRGVFNLACQEHQGLSDLHAEHVSVVEKGAVKEEQVNLMSFIPGVILVGAGAVLMLVFYYLRERQR